MGKKKCKPTECPAGEKWAVPYADFLSLLLALFIALYALASVNTEKMKALKEEFVKIYDYSAKPEEATPVMSMAVKSGEAAKDKDKGNAGGSSAQLEEIARLAQMIEKMNIGEGSLEQKIDGAILKLPTKMLSEIPRDSNWLTFPPMDMFAIRNWLECLADNEFLSTRKGESQTKIDDLKREISSKIYDENITVFFMHSEV